MVPLLRELRTIAAHRLRKHDSLRPTEVVNEAYLRLRQVDGKWDDSRQFRVLAARTIRSVLVDHARARAAQKRGGDRKRITLVEGLAVQEGASLDILALDQALEELVERKPRHARVIELRFFGGMTFPEIGTELGIRADTAKDYWAYAKAWLMKRIVDESIDAKSG